MVARIYNCRGHFSDVAWFAMKVWLDEDGENERTVATRLNVSPSTVHRQRAFNTPPSTREGRVRPADKDVKVRRRLVKRLAGMVVKKTGYRGVSERAKPMTFTKARFDSAKAIAAEVNVRTKTAVSATTVRRDLHANGMVSYVVRKGPQTKEGDGAARHLFCKKVVGATAPQIIFTDEKMANTNFHGLRRRWCMQGSHPQPMGCGGRFAAAVHVWGAVGVGYRKLVVLPKGGINGALYRKLCLAPTLKALRARGTPFLWQQDNARPHTANETWMEKNKVPQLQPSWPPRSPDLSPIETIWAIVQRRVDAHTCSSHAELEAAWVKVFNELDQSIIDNTVLSFMRRVRNCAKHNGSVAYLPGRTVAQKKADAAKASAPKIGQKKR
jgi:hypothetical protein